LRRLYKDKQMMYQFIRSLIIIAVFLVGNTVCAEIYKWVDERGKVQFSQTPPNPSAEKVEIKNSQSTATTNTQSDVSSAEKEKRYLDYLRQERIDREISKAEKDEQQAKLQARCNRSLADYNDLDAGGRFYELNAQGKRVYLSDQQIDEEKEKLKKFLDSSCPKS